MSDTPPSSATRRMRTIARCVRVMALIAMAVVVGFHGAFWTNPGMIERSARKEWGLSGLLQLDAGSRALGALANLPESLLTLYALLCLWRLFGGYLRGNVFEEAAVRHLRRLGQSVMAMALMMPLTQTATVLALTWGNPPGQRLLNVCIGSQHYVVLLCGLVFTAMALVMREAQRLARENAEFV